MGRVGAESLGPMSLPTGNQSPLSSSHCPALGASESIMSQSWVTAEAAQAQRGAGLVLSGHTAGQKES